MLSVIHAECHYAECRYAKCRSTFVSDIGFHAAILAFVLGNLFLAILAIAQGSIWQSFFCFNRYLSKLERLSSAFSVSLTYYHQL
jgi:hypothetical protein